jgi:hypothetical protein
MSKRVSVTELQIVAVVEIFCCVFSILLQNFKHTGAMAVTSHLFVWLPFVVLLGNVLVSRLSKLDFTPCVVMFSSTFFSVV